MHCQQTSSCGLPIVGIAACACVLLLGCGGEPEAVSPKGIKGNAAKAGAAGMTRAQFIKKLDEIKTQGTISPIVYAVFKARQFRESFGEPDSDIQLSGFDRFWTYHCADGVIQVKVAVYGDQNDTLLLSELSQLK